MKRMITLLLLFSITISVFGSCRDNNPNTDTTIVDTEPAKEPEIRKSKPYPNALKVSAYSLLTDSEKALYEAIAKLISSPEVSKSVSIKRSVDTNCFDMIMDIFKANFTSHEAVLEKITYTETDGKITAVSISEDFDEGAFNEEYEAVSSKADEIIASIPTKLSDKEIVFEIVDYLCENIILVNDNEETTTYTALIENKADSEGFAKAFDLLLKKAGISSFTVYDYERNTEYDISTNQSTTTYTFPEPRHYWNYLCLWNKWYELDLSKLHSFWFDAGEMFLNIDTLIADTTYPYSYAYYFYRTDMEKMQLPMTEQWQNSMNSYENSEEVINLLKSASLEALAKDSYDYSLKIKFKNIDATEKFLENNRTTIKDKTGTEYTLYLRKEAGEVDIVNVTPVKVIDFNNISYTTESYKFDFCFTYDENVDYRDQEALTYFDPITISIDIPEHWSGKEGRYFKYFDKTDYSGYTSAMSIMRLVQTGVTLDEANSKGLAGGELYMSEFFTGTTSNGNNYSYYLQREPRGIEGYYSVLIRISPDYVVHLCIEDELEREDITMKVIDSITINK